MRARAIAEENESECGRKTRKKDKRERSGEEIRKERNNEIQAESCGRGRGCGTTQN